MIGYLTNKIYYLYYSQGQGGDVKDGRLEVAPRGSEA